MNRLKKEDSWNRIIALIQKIVANVSIDFSSDISDSFSFIDLMRFNAQYIPLRDLLYPSYIFQTCSVPL